MRFSREDGLASKASGFKKIPVRQPDGKVGFVFSSAEMKKLDDLKTAMNTTAKSVNSGSRFVAAGLGAVALGLAFNAMTRPAKK